MKEVIETNRRPFNGFVLYDIAQVVDGISVNDTHVSFGNEELVEFIETHNSIDENLDIQTSRKVGVSLTEIYDIIPDLEIGAQDLILQGETDHPIHEFLVQVNKENERFLKTFQRNLDNGKVSFGSLRYFIRKGDILVWKDRDNLEAGEVISAFHREHMLMGPYFSISVSRVVYQNGMFGKEIKQLTIPKFAGYREIDLLAARHITEKEREYLTDRGRKWKSLISSPSYKYYDGQVWMPSFFGKVSLTVSGRCMIDPVTAEKSELRAYSDFSDEQVSLSDNFLYSCPSFVKGFSFSRKLWGEFSVDDLSPIIFREDAYDCLVMDQDNKDEVRALVEFSNEMFSDVISGKGGGAIFLLHGVPGVGKTMTAESVAEILHKPLYSISVGELGITPSEVEDKLSSILEMVSTWDAVLLLDEADIFLEQRSKEDVVRNAMVGVFLRLLEYHNGVLFLTSNRVESFDTAIMSRISVILKYNELTITDRKKVWDNILSSAGIPEGVVNTDYMALTYHINGRQIKNAIRIGLARARSLNQMVSQELIEKAISRMISSEKDLAKSA